MMKLVDYFVIVGYVDEDSDEEKNAEFDDDDDDDNNSSNGGAVIVVDDEGLAVSNVESDVKLKRHQKKINSIGKAKIIQRFPLSCDNKVETLVEKKRCQSQEKDEVNDENRECSLNDEQQEFDENIHCFCQPHKGWRLYAKQEAPTFFVSVLTDIKGKFWI
jgi:hypothetical protein